ncbi:MAG: amidophosphoribosyltransferase, partial [Patescibacteria group bacterium]|nr:amidophosphoribosyltransferase [Patescibacteria group bacterium]
RKAGAKEVHLLSASPKVKYPDFYGIATPTQEELIASHMSVEEICQFVDADSIQYLSYEGLIAATGLPESKFCTSCFTGNYPIDIGEEHRKHINFNV